MTITRLTTSGDVRGCGSISPDGKYVVYCDFSNRLWVRQVVTGATVQIANSGGVTTFSPDSNFVYVSDRNDEHPNGVLTVIPSFGGEPRRVVANIKGAVGLSPDGQQIAFLRDYPAERQVALMIADALGGPRRTARMSAYGALTRRAAGRGNSHDTTRRSRPFRRTDALSPFRPSTRIDFVSGACSLMAPTLAC